MAANRCGGDERKLTPEIVAAGGRGMDWVDSLCTPLSRWQMPRPGLPSLIKALSPAVQGGKSVEAD